LLVSLLFPSRGLYQNLDIFNARWLFALPLFAFLHFLPPLLSSLPHFSALRKKDIFSFRFIEAHEYSLAAYIPFPGRERLFRHLFFALCFIFVQGQQYFMHHGKAVIQFVFRFLFRDHYRGVKYWNSTLAK